MPTSLAVLIASTLIAGEPPPPPITFAKHALGSDFVAEAAAIADLDGDAKADAVIGPWWYVWNGKAFDRKGPIWQQKAFDGAKGYSDVFAQYAGDVSGDGQPDVLTNVWPGKEVAAFINPGNGAGTWQRRVCHPAVDNESPLFTDITGDGKPELVFHTGGVLGYATPGAQFPWPFTGVSEKGTWHRYTHGLGVGDVDGDGRNDLMLAEGWWKQGASAPWAHRKQAFGGGGAQMHAYDVDGDGDNDVVTSLNAHGYGLAWFEQLKDGGWKQHVITGAKEADSPYGVKFSQLHAVELADLDGDGLKDIITGKRWWAHGPKGDAEPDAAPVLYWFRLVRGAGADGGAAFIPYRIDDASGVGTQVAVADVTGDGLPDIAIGNKRGSFLFVQQRGTK